MFPAKASKVAQSLESRHMLPHSTSANINLVRPIFAQLHCQNLWLGCVQGTQPKTSVGQLAVENFSTHTDIDAFVSVVARRWQR